VSASAGYLCIRACCTEETLECCDFGGFPQIFCRIRCLKDMGLLFAKRLCKRKYISQVPRDVTSDYFPGKSKD